MQPMRSAIFLLLAILAVPDSQAALAQSGARLPGWLDDYATKNVRLPAAQRSQLLGGQAVTAMMESNPSNEVAVFGAVWIDAPMGRYVAAVNDIEDFEKGDNFRV